VDRQALLTFVSAGRRLALPMETVRRVVPLPLLELPVAAPAFVEGFFDFGGTPVVAVRLDRLLNLGDESLGIYSPLLILHGEELPVALHVTSVTSILKLTSLDVQPIGRDETFNACIVGRLSDRGETVYVLSAKDLLLAEERSAIAAHRAMHKRRLAALADVPAEARAEAS
jgi:purine-binding chemotaxis protein CheW